MADNVAITAGSGTSIATDQIGSDHYQLIKLAFGPLDTATVVSTSNGLPVNVLNASLAVTDNAGSLTVDAPATTPVFVRLSTGSAAIDTIPVTLASVPSHAVTNAGTFAVQVSSALPTGANVVGAVTQSGTWTVTGAGGTFPITAASLPLPTGAATETTLASVQTILANVSDTVNTAITAAHPVIDTRAILFAVNPGGTYGNIERTSGGNLKVAVEEFDAALPAGTNLLGRTSASNETSTVYSGTTALTPKFAIIQTSASGDTVEVAAVTGKKIRVLRFSAVASGAVNIKFRSNTTDVTGLYYLSAAGASAGGAYCPVGIFETVAGETLNINLSAAVAVGGVLTYIEV